MSRLWNGIKKRFSSVDKDDVLKWSFLIGGGLLSLASGIFDQRKKDRIYKEGLASEIKDQVRRVMEKDKTA